MYRLVTVRTYGDFIILLGHQHHDLISHSVVLSQHWAKQLLLFPDNTECLAQKQQVSNFKSSVWLNQELNSYISHMRGPRSTNSTTMPGSQLVGQAFDSQSSQTNDWQNWYLSLLSLALAQVSTHPDFTLDVNRMRNSNKQTHIGGLWEVTMPCLLNAA